MQDERTRRWLTWLTTAVVVLPSLVAIARAWAEQWTPTSDNALTAIRALDVLGLDHHPLVGTWSSISDSVDSTVHHPGPLLFDVLAVPASLLGTDIGIPLAVGVVNALCSWWVVSVIGRVGGLGARIVAAVVVALLCWSMSWPVLIETFQPHVAMLPGLLFFVSCGALTIGERRAALPAVVGGSLCLQPHIGYLVVVVLTLLVTAGLRWRNRGIGRPWSISERLLPLGVLVVLWTQPLIDLIANRGDSNVAAIIGAAGSNDQTVGLSLATRLVAAVVAVPPWWLPAGFDGPSVFDPPPSLAIAALGLLAVAILLLLVAWHGSGFALRSFGLYVAALLPVAVIAVALVPPNPLVGYSRNQWRWLWAVGALAALVVGWAAVAELRQRLDRRTLVVASGAACVSALVVATTAGAGERPLEQREQRAIAELVDGLPFAELEDCAQVVVDYEAGFAAPALVAPSVMLALRERDIEFAPTAADGFEQLDRRPAPEATCRLALSLQRPAGRLVGELPDPLAMFVTFAPEP